MRCAEYGPVAGRESEPLLIRLVRLVLRWLLRVRLRLVRWLRLPVKVRSV